jgi:cell division septation protein DedD
MRVESGGHEYINGQLTVSAAGAMGLMQLEPETYREMATQYGLGTDPFNPRDNIMAGAAYIHAMYQIFGSPGFLAAYNAGPGRLDSYMTYRTALPDETVNYVAMIAPHIQGYYPAHRSQADQLALNTLPMSEAPGILPPGFVPEASSPSSRDASIAAVEVASNEPSVMSAPAIYTPSSALDAPLSLPLPPPPAPVQTSVVASNWARPQAVPLPPPPHGFSVIPEAMADTLPPPSPRPSLPSYMAPPRHSGWAIQVGAYNTSSNARDALGIAELSAVQMLMGGRPMVISVRADGHTKYRARFVGLLRDDAINACTRLAGGPTGCIVLRPEEQS